MRWLSRSLEAERGIPGVMMRMTVLLLLQDQNKMQKCQVMRSDEICLYLCIRDHWGSGWADSSSRMSNDVMSLSYGCCCRWIQDADGGFRWFHAAHGLYIVLLQMAECRSLCRLGMHG